MAELTFKSAGFFDFETEVSNPQSVASGVPIAVIGTAEKGPAFTPVYFGRAAKATTNMANFIQVFGKIEPHNFGPYAVKAWFDGQQTAAQYVRVLGSGGNTTAAQFTTTINKGIVAKAGFKVHHPMVSTFAQGPNPSGVSDFPIAPLQPSAPGTVFFIAGKHTIPSAADVGLTHFTENDSFKGVASSGDDTVHLIRAMLFTTTGSVIQIADYDEVNIATPRSGIPAYNSHISGSVSTKGQSDTSKFKLIVSSSKHNAFAKHDDRPGHKVFTCSLDPDSQYYVSKVLNTNPQKLDEAQHLLYIDWPVTTANAVVEADVDSICLLSGSNNTSGAGLSDTLSTGTNQFLNLFGRYDTRYKTPRTPYFISQPFGKKEYDLFYIETISDGAVANDDYKISILNIRASSIPSQPYGTFDLVLRAANDTDQAQEVLERYSSLTLDPSDINYIGRRIGDMKSVYNFDAAIEKRRFTKTGTNPLKSGRIRVVVHPGVVSRQIPPSALPFGFRGIPVLKTSPNLREVSSQTDDEAGTPDGVALGDNPRLHSCVGRLVAGVPSMAGYDHSGASLQEKRNAAATAFTGSIIPPLPMRFKIAGSAALKASSLEFMGQPSTTTTTNGALYWGVQYDNQRSALKPWDIGDTALEGINGIVKAYAKFQGIGKIDMLYTGSAADKFNNNKFTLAKVALYHQLSAAGALQNITGSAKKHMKDACYIRNGQVNSADYTVYDRVQGKNRVTLATILDKDADKYNKFSSYAKFTAPFYGGFDGLNIFDVDAARMNDKATSTASNAKGASTISNGLGITGSDDASLMGTGLTNSAVQAYRAAVDILTDRYKSIHHVLAIPGIREPLITDYAASQTRSSQFAMYIMDIPHYDKDGNRIFIEDTTVPSVPDTISSFKTRAWDNNYVATYFPDAIINDDLNNGRKLEVPASVVAVQAIAYSDKASAVWFAPAGFTRGGLSNVSNTTTRLSTLDRDDLYEAKINPIANFPNDDYKIWGQKTLQRERSSLDRVNVRRMILEVKRQILYISRRLLFKRNNKALRKLFVQQLSPKLSFIQMNRGIEAWKIIMDDTNNTLADQQQYRLNGVVKVVPTRTIEFVTVDFIIDPDGVTFQ